MKIKLAIPDENMEEIRQFFEEKGFTIDEDADYILTQRQRYVGHLSVRNPGNGDKAFVDVNDILGCRCLENQMMRTHMGISHIRLRLKTKRKQCRYWTMSLKMTFIRNDFTDI